MGYTHVHVAGRQSGTPNTASATRCTGIRAKHTEKARTVRCSATSQAMFHLFFKDCRST